MRRKPVSDDQDSRIAPALADCAEKKKVRADIATRLTPKRASKLRRQYLADMHFLPTGTMRIHRDVLVLARTAWPNNHERVRECSDAIRVKASTKLNLSGVQK